MNSRRKAQAWHAEKHMEAYCRRRDENHEQHLGDSRKDGQGQIEMDDLCSGLHANGISGNFTFFLLFFSGIRDAQFLVFCVVFCIPLFVPFTLAIVSPSFEL